MVDIAQPQEQQAESFSKSAISETQQVVGNHSTPLGSLSEETTSQIMGCPPSLEPSQVRTPARDDDEYEDVRSKISRLPKVWMRAYAEALILTRGQPYAARQAIVTRCGMVSAASVDKYRAADSLFDEVCKEGDRMADDLVDYVVHTDATEGFATPVFQQGVQVGEVKKPNTKAAELYYKRRGLLAEQTVNVRQSGQINIVHQAAISQTVADRTRQLFGKVVEMEALEEGA